MNRMMKILLLAATPLLMAALGMDDQPSFKPYEAPLLQPPSAAVPLTGKETPVSWNTRLENPVPPAELSLARGKRLFEINCFMCHGRQMETGPVGKKLSPPPPDLALERVQTLSDGDIFKRITLGFGRMPAFRNRLSPEERWDLVNFLRTLK